MADAPRWSILIPTLSARRTKLIRLLSVLLPQAEAAGCVEVVGCSNNGRPSLGEIRQALMEAAEGEYLSFCDDDDLVAPDFVAACLEAMESGPDVVQFWHAYHVSGEFRGLTLCSLALEPSDWRHLMYRDLTHIQPVRAGLARLGSFGTLGCFEDSAWREGVLPHLRTEVVIGRALYRYMHAPADSVQFRSAWPALPRPGIASPCFRWIDVP